MASASEKPVTLLLLGRTGNGKSSTGNSIVGKRAFKTSGSNGSSTYETSKESLNIHGKEVLVVDGLSVQDIQADKQEDETEALLKAMDEAFFTHCSKSFSALLVILKYGIRYTRQEKDAVMTFKSIFGSDVLKKHGVIVMTRGDSFEMDMEDEESEVTFEEWCKAQGGDVKILFEECNYRCVIFNNKSKDSNKLENQFKTLMEKVGHCEEYTERDYEEAQDGRTKLIVLSKLPKLEEETRIIVDKITASLNQISQAGDYGSDNAYEILTRLKKELDEHETHLTAEDNGTDVVKRPLGDMKLMKMRIETVFKLMQLQKQELNSPEEQQELQKEVNEIEEQEKKDSVSIFWPYISGYLYYLYNLLPDLKSWLYIPVQWYYGEHQNPDKMPDMNGIKMIEPNTNAHGSSGTRDFVVVEMTKCDGSDFQETNNVADDKSSVEDQACPSGDYVKVEVETNVNQGLQ